MREQPKHVIVREVNLGRQGDYTVASCQYCGASAAVREDTSALAEGVPRTFAEHHQHLAARERKAA
jgi:hypothetical protein